MDRLYLVVPCYNEEEVLPETVRRLTDKLRRMEEKGLVSGDSRILLVDDGSRDRTWELICGFHQENPTVSGLKLSRNRGHQNALLAGLMEAKKRCDCVVSMDADLQDPPSLIPKMLEWWEKGYDDVYAKRYDRGKESWIRKRCSLLFYAILQHSTRFEVLQNVGDFRLLDRVCIDALKKMRETERYTKGMFCWIGFKKKELIFNRGDRVAGKSNWNFGSLFNLAIEGITSFTTTPLRFSAVLGFIIAFLSLGLMLFYFLKALIWGDPIQGFPTLVVIILFLGGIQLLSIGILGEYLGRIFNESKHRPIYIAREYNGKKVD